MYTELQYPVFLNASQYAGDTFWKYIFEDLAYGRTPYGTYITKDFICCNYKGKEFSYKIDTTKTGEQLYNELYSILFNKFGLLSMEDKQVLRSKFEKTRDSTSLINSTSWAGIKKKNIKQLMIENFVITAKKKYVLSQSHTKKLLSYIIIGLIFKTIENDDIDFCDGKIVTIKGFEFEKNNFVKPTNLFVFDSNTAQSANSKKKLSDMWEKYLVNFKKNRSFK
jgi:hypothetical protein